MSNLESITGRILHVSQYTSDAHCHTYNLIEVDTPSGRVDLQTVMASNELHRAIEPRRDVAMTVLRSDAGSRKKTVILGIYDLGEKRTFANEEVFTLRDHARKQAVLYSLMSIVVLPVAFLLFVVPGFVWLWVRWKLWSSVGEFPTPAEIRESGTALSTVAPTWKPA